MYPSKENKFYFYIQGLIDIEKEKRSIARKNKHHDEIVEAGAKIVAYEHLRNEFKKKWHIVFSSA